MQSRGSRELGISRPQKHTYSKAIKGFRARGTLNWFVSRRKRQARQRSAVKMAKKFRLGGVRTANLLHLIFQGEQMLNAANSKWPCQTKPTENWQQSGCLVFSLRSAQQRVFTSVSKHPLTTGRLPGATAYHPDSKTYLNLRIKCDGRR